MNEDDDETIAHCPFCDMGKEASKNWPEAISVPGVAMQPWTDKYAVLCDWCGAWGPTMGTESDAIRMWNWRSKQ